jgi:26S proteasome regulatory subunit T2
VDDIRGSPMTVGSLEEIIDDNHAIVSSATGPEYYVSILSFVDRDELEPGSSILLHNKARGLAMCSHCAPSHSHLFMIVCVCMYVCIPVRVCVHGYCAQAMSVVGVLQDETDPMVSVMKLEKAPTESYADVGGLEQQIQEIKVLDLPRSHTRTRALHVNALDGAASAHVSLSLCFFLSWVAVHALTVCLVRRNPWSCR